MPGGVRERFIADALAHGEFEWVADWEEIAPLLTPAALGLSKPELCAADIGCGTSALAANLARLPGFGSVVGLDREEACVAHMRSTHGEEGGLRWRVADVTAEEAGAALPDGGFDLVVDKGTCDCALVEHDAARLLRNVWRALAPGGVYLIVSFRSRDLLLPILSAPQLPWAAAPDARALDLASASGRVATVVTLRKPAEAGEAAEPPDVDALHAHVSAVLDAWYRDTDPLLTPRREAKLRREWAAALDARARAPVELTEGAAEGTAEGAAPAGLPLRAAYVLLFTEEEREEMSFADFLGDAEPFLARHGDGADEISLQQALAFIEEMQ
jgi:SAM-dependent methyltransferase